MRNCDSRIGVVSTLNENFRQYGGVTNRVKGEEILKCIEHYEMKTVTDRVKWQKNRNGLDSAYERKKALYYYGGP